MNRGVSHARPPAAQLCRSRKRQAIGIERRSFGTANPAQPCPWSTDYGNDDMAILNNLSKAALSAAMRGGTDGWGKVGSATDHVRYCEPQLPSKRKKCRCGCGQRASHRGMVNGVCMTIGCELRIRRWVRDGTS